MCYSVNSVSWDYHGKCYGHGRDKAYKRMCGISVSKKTCGIRACHPKSKLHSCLFVCCYCWCCFLCLLCRFGSVPAGTCGELPVVVHFGILYIYQLDLIHLLDSKWLTGIFSSIGGDPMSTAHRGMLQSARKTLSNSTMLEMKPEE